MEPTERKAPNNETERSKAEIFTHDLDRINAVIISMLLNETTDTSELREAWNVRADLAEAFIDSLEPTQDNPDPKPRVQFDILIDKALIFETVGDTIRYLEELDEAEAFARTYDLIDMTNSVAEELEEKVKELGDTPEELILKLRGQLNFPKRYKLRKMLQDGISHDDFMSNINRMLHDRATGAEEILIRLNDVE